MNEISPQQLLAQIRTLNSELQGSTVPPAKTGEASGFGDFLKTAIDSVNASQQTAAALKRDFESERKELQQIIIDALTTSNGNRAAVAEKLGISPRTLRYKLARLRKAGVALPFVSAAGSA